MENAAPEGGMECGEATPVVGTRNAGGAPSLHHLGRLAAATEALASGAHARAPLRGRHVALLSASPLPDGSERLDAIEAAATALGARTARPAIAHPFPDAELVMLAGLYQLVCSDASLGDLASRIRQLGVPVMQGLLEPYHPVALVALLLAVQRQVPARAPIVLDCVEPAAGTTLAAEAAAMLGVPLRAATTSAADAWRLAPAPGGYAAWRLGPPTGMVRDPACWTYELERMRGLALQAALLRQWSNRG
jgi:hypothetical protein